MPGLFRTRSGSDLPDEPQFFGPAKYDASIRKYDPYLRGDYALDYPTPDPNPIGRVIQFITNLQNNPSRDELGVTPPWRSAATSTRAVRRGRIHPVGEDLFSNMELSPPWILSMDEALGIRNPFAYPANKPQDPIGAVAKTKTDNYLSERMRQLKEQYVKAKQEAPPPSMERQFGTKGSGETTAIEGLSNEMYEASSSQDPMLRILGVTRSHRSHDLSLDRRANEFVHLLQEAELQEAGPYISRFNLLTLFDLYRELRRNAFPEDAFREAVARWRLNSQ